MSQASVHLSLIFYSYIHYCGNHFVLQNGWTALMLASDSGHTDIVQLLLSSGAKVDLQNKVRHIMLYLVHKSDGFT